MDNGHTKEKQEDSIFRQKNSEKRKYPFWLLGLVGFSGVTFLGLFVIEVFLRSVGFGHDTRLFIPFEESGEKYYRDNPKFFWRYMGENMARNPMPMRIPQDKKKNSIRIVVLGESAALGDPAPAYGFARFLEVLLESKYPQKDFEIINTSTTAINSHVIRDIAKDCIKLDADYWLGYLGNNEFLGPFGPGSVFAGGQHGSLSSIRLGLALRKFKIGQLIDKMIQSIKVSKNNGKQGKAWQGMEMFSNKSIPLQSEGRLIVHKNFRKNLEAILRFSESAGSKLILAPGVANLRSCGPFAWASQSLNTSSPDFSGEILSLMRGQEPDLTALQAEVKTFLQKNPEDASAYFYSGIMKEKLGDKEEAKIDFQKACDFDLLPFRMPSTLRQVLLSIEGNQQLKIIDPRLEMESGFSTEILGNEAFFEHVHLRPKGNYLLALSFAKLIQQDLEESQQWEPNDNKWMDFSDCSEVLALSGYDKFSMAKDMISRIQTAPLSVRPFNEVNVENLLNELQSPVATESEAESLSLYERAIDRNPNDWLLRQRYALYLDEVGKAAMALDQVDTILKIVPHSPVTHFQRGVILNSLDRSTEAKQAFVQSLKLRPSFAEARLQIAWIDWKEGDKELAEEGFDEAALLDPGLESPQLARLIALKEKNDTEKFWRLLRRMSVQFPHSNNVASELYAFGSIDNNKTKVLEFLKATYENDGAKTKSELPGNAEIFTSYGKLLQLDGQFDKAKEVYFQTGWEFGNINALYLFGMGSAMSGEMEKAIESFSKVIEKRPDFWSAYLNYGVALAKVDRYTLAYEVFSKIPKTDPNFQNAKKYMDEIARWDQNAIKPSE